MEPKSVPPAISATIMVPQSAMTSHVLRALCSWCSPRKTCSWRKSSIECACIIALSLFDVCAKNFQQLAGGGLFGPRALTIRIDHVHLDVIFHDFSHDRIDGAARSGEKAHDLATSL